MTAFGELLEREIHQKVVLRALRLFLLFVMVFSVCFVVFRFTSIKSKSQRVLNRADREQMFSSVPSSDLLSQLRELCNYSSCRELQVFNTATQELYFSIPEQPGNTVLLEPEKPFPNQIRLEALSKNVRIFLVVPIWTFINFPLVLMVFFLMATIGSSILLRETGNAVSKIFANELLQLQQDNPSKFITTEGENIYMLMREQSRKIENFVKEEAEFKKTKALADIAVQVAHDIRSPISALRALLANRELPQQEHAKILEMAIRRVQQIADDLLDRYKTDVNERFDVVGTLVELIAEKEASVPNLKLKFKSNVNQLEWRGSKSDFSRALSNFINNAIEATMMGTAPHVSVIIERNLNGVMCTVSDCGSGIPRETLDLLLYQPVKSSKTVGTGVGIYGAKKLLEKMGLSVKIQSIEGQGTDIFISGNLISQNTNAPTSL